MVVMIMGLPGSGKSYFATRLATAIHAEYLSSDRIRKTVVARRTYSLDEKEMVYDEMLLQMKQAIMQNKNVVLDATFYKSETRKKFIDATRETGGIFLIEIKSSESLIKERLSKSREESDADYNVYKIIKKEWEPVWQPHLTLQSSDDNLISMLDSAKTYIYRINDESVE